MDSSILWTISNLNFTGIICNYNCSNFIIDVCSEKVYEAMALSMTSPRPLDPTDSQLVSTPLIIVKSY